ncbi:MAG: V-type ATP synthase subunit E family protein [Nanoarchaeota archaeon]
MGLEELKFKIEKETETDAVRIEDEGKAEARRIIEAARNELQKQRQVFKEETDHILEKIEQKASTDAQFEAKRSVMLKKKEMLDEIFQDVKKTLTPKSKAQLPALLKKAQSQMQVSAAYVNTSDKKSLAGATIKEAPIIGGLIAESHDGTVRLDYSFDTFLEQAWQENLNEIVGKLFK